MLLDGISVVRIDELSDQSEKEFSMGRELIERGGKAKQSVKYIILYGGCI